MHFMFPKLATFQYFSTIIVYAFHVSQACHIPVFFYHNCLRISCFPSLPHSNIFLPELSRHFMFPKLATFQHFSTRIVYAFHVSQTCHIPIFFYQNCLGISCFPSLPHSKIFLPELSTHFMFPKFATFPVHFIPTYL